ncbi:MAG: nucleoside triphosphate pyrophosphohydrolase [Candidatus Nomurabacteria bacterium]|nr:MAG: nucleoside triphosphate pyrophosphohydrolase [Candidatus Nomurabacteria bacterium]
MKKRGQTYNKLVRDLIPEIIAEDGYHAEIRVLDEVEYLKALREKLFEEAKELAEAPDVTAITNELIDLYEVLAAFEKAYGLRHSEVIELQEKKRAERGGFKKRLFLVRTELDEDEE